MTTKPTCETCQAFWRDVEYNAEHGTTFGDCRAGLPIVSESGGGEDCWPTVSSQSGCMQHIPIEAECEYEYTASTDGDGNVCFGSRKVNHPPEGKMNLPEERIKELEDLVDEISHDRDNWTDHAKSMRSVSSDYHKVLDEANVFGSAGTLMSARIKSLIKERDEASIRINLDAVELERLKGGLAIVVDAMKWCLGSPGTTTVNSSVHSILTEAIEFAQATPTQPESTEDVPLRETYSSNFPKENADG